MNSKNVFSPDSIFIFLYNLDKAMGVPCIPPERNFNFLVIFQGFLMDVRSYPRYQSFVFSFHF